MNGGYGADGRRDAGRRPGRGGHGETDGTGGSGYGDEGYGLPGYRDSGYGGTGGYGQSPADGRGYGDEGYGVRGPAATGPGGGPSDYGQEGYGGGRAAGGPGGYGRSGGYPGQGYGDRPDPRSQGQRGGAGARQYDPRTGPQPTSRGGERQQGQHGGQWRQGLPGAGTGPRQVQRGTGQARQEPRGYDPRGSAPRRAADGSQGAGYPGDGYPGGGYRARGDASFGQDQYGGWDSQAREDSFLPGFGRREEFDRGRDPGRGGGAGYAGAAAPYAGPHDDHAGGRRGRRARSGRDHQGGEDDWDDGDRPRSRRGPIRRLAPWIALVVILTPLLVGALYVYNLYESKYHPADYSGPGTGPTLTVQVKSGDSAFSLGPRLASLGVVASARAFELAAEHSSSPAGLEAGFFKLHHHMQASLAYAALLNPKNRVQLTVTVPEGKRVSQVVAQLAKATSIPAADFQQVIDHPAQLGLPSYAKGKVEGYLFPATYHIQPNETALQILRTMVQRYDLEARQVNLTAAANKVGLTAEQVIIEASMAQAEGGSVSDYPKIARVIINRLHAGMDLQFDSVLLYGLNAYGVNITYKQRNTPGPYNDFEHSGLPPTPICNPGDAAIQGILHPASGPWLYFLTNSSGKSTFSATPLTGQ